MTLLYVIVLYSIALSVGLARCGSWSRAATRGGAPRSHPARILIVGATGGTGRQLLSQALERGHAITALVRDPSRLMVKHPKLTVLQGDVLDYASVEAAVRGQDAVLSALGHKRYFHPTRILSEGTRNLLRAMETHGVPRFVCETTLGIGDSTGRMGLYYTFFVIPFILPFYFWDKTRQEQLVAASNVEWVIVRPGALANASGRGVYRQGRSVGSFLWTVRVSRADVARFMLDQVEDDSHLGSAVGVCR